jgi:hypothetical protein
MVLPGSGLVFAPGLATLVRWRGGETRKPNTAGQGREGGVSKCNQSALLVKDQSEVE